MSRRLFAAPLRLPASRPPARRPFCALVAVALALVLVAPPAAARDITGAMTYAERVALPEGAELRIELRGAEGVVAEVSIATDGRQVPLPFVIVAPGIAENYRLRGAVFVGGRAEWLSDEIAVPAGEAALALGDVALRRHVAMGFISRMRCGATELEVGFVDQDAVLRAGGEAFRLAPVVAASGARFSDGATPETAFWSRGNGALVTLKGEELAECAPVIAPPLLPVTARGNEPFWRLDLTETGWTYAPMDGPARTGALPEPVAVTDGARFDLAADLSITLARTLCRDSMAGMPYPLTANLQAGGAGLAGCAGDPAELLEGRWNVTTLDDAAVSEVAEVTLVFDPREGGVFGKSACNRYRGGFTLTGEGLSFGPAAGTMMACPDDLMAVERSFLTTLETVDRFDVAPDGALELVAGDRVVIRARR